MFDEQEWKSVLQVAKDGTFSTAAKNLYMTQPSLSQCVRKIEEELGEELFDRRHTPLRLTKAGELYVRQAREFERMQRELVLTLAQEREMGGARLVLGSSPARAECYLLSPLVRFRSLYPGVHLSVKKASDKELLEALKGGEVDLALLYAPLPDESLKAEPLLREQVLLAVPQGHRLTKGMSSQPMPLPKVSFKDLAGEPFVMAHDEETLTRDFEKLCKVTGARPEVVFEAASVTDAVQLATAGMGLTLVTDMLLYHLPLANTPIFFELKEELPERELVAAHGEKMSVAAQKFVEVLRKAQG